jgi:hypothetical protein
VISAFQDGVKGSKIKAALPGITSMATDAILLEYFDRGRRLGQNWNRDNQEELRHTLTLRDRNKKSFLEFSGNRSLAAAALIHS